MKMLLLTRICFRYVMYTWENSKLKEPFHEFRSSRFSTLSRNRPIICSVFRRLQNHHPGTRNRVKCLGNVNWRLRLYYYSEKGNNYDINLASLSWDVNLKNSSVWHVNERCYSMYARACVYVCVCVSLWIRLVYNAQL